MIKSKKCKISGCENERYANTSWCYSHYIEHEKEKKAKKEEKAIAKLNDKIKKQAQKDLWRIVHNRVWKLMSEYIRTKDADEFGYNTCYTCGARKHWKELQCGHYKHDKLDFDERNLKRQCLTEESNIKMLDGSYKSISKIQEGDFISAFDEETFNEKIACVGEVESFIPDKLYEVELVNGNKFYATGDHKIVANNKWYKIEDILENFNNLEIKEL